MNRAELKARAKALLKPQYVTVLLTVLISGLLVGLLHSSPVVNISNIVNNAKNSHTIVTISTSTNNFSLIGMIIGLLIGGPLSVGAIHVYTTVTSGQTAKLEQLFEPFKTNFVTCFLAHLVSNLVIALFSLLLVIPGIMRAYSYAMVPYVLAKEPQLSAMEALSRSKQLMKGHRMELFCLQLSFIGWVLLTIVTLGLALIWFYPYAEITETLFFDKIYDAA